METSKHLTSKHCIEKNQTGCRERRVENAKLNLAANIAAGPAARFGLYSNRTPVVVVGAVSDTKDASASELIGRRRTETEGM